MLDRIRLTHQKLITTLIPNPVTIRLTVTPNTARTTTIIQHSVLHTIEQIRNTINNDSTKINSRIIDCLPSKRVHKTNNGYTRL